MSRTVPALVGLVLLLASCDQSANRVSTLWTDVPEMASYVEKFNAAQREWQILVEYREAPAALLTTPGRKADLVVARGLASTAVKDTLVSLDFLFDGGNLAKASFYRRILDAGTQGDQTRLIPVAFDLPILVFAPDRSPGVPGQSLDLTTLKQLNKDFMADDPTSSRRLAFSPRWNGFGLYLLKLGGTSLQEGFQGTLSWDSAKLATSLTTYREWPSPGWQKATEFQAKYLQSDPAPPLAAGRIQFYPSTLSAYFSRPWEDRQDLDFRFLDDGAKLVAAENVVWAGIPSSSLTRGAGERFLAWFLQGETQKKLLLQARTEDSRSFGLAGGLSAQSGPNLAALPLVFPELAGRVPSADQIVFWGPLPLDWPSLKTAVLKPWLENQTADEASLKTSLERHRAQAVRN